MMPHTRVIIGFKRRACYLCQPSPFTFLYGRGRKWLCMWNLIIHIPDSFPKPYSLPNGKTSIGRLATNDIVVDDPGASRHHAELWVDEAQEKISIADLDSTNGTF